MYMLMHIHMLLEKNQYNEGICAQHTQFRSPTLFIGTSVAPAESEGALPETTRFGLQCWIGWQARANKNLWHLKELYIPFEPQIFVVDLIICGGQLGQCHFEGVACPNLSVLCWSNKTLGTIPAGIWSKMKNDTSPPFPSTAMRHPHTSPTLRFQLNTHPFSRVISVTAMSKAPAHRAA